MSHLPVGQHEHAWHIYNNPDYFTNVQRAWAVFILSKLGFGGQLSSSFGFDKSEGKHPLKIQYAKEMALCAEIKTLLEHSTIECDDAFAIINRYDCPDAWFFIDPPYVGSNMGHYSGMFNEQNLIELLDMCTGLQGKFMLTMYPNDAIKEYAEKHNWTIHRVNRLISACKAEARRMQEEWMTCNYKQVSNNTLFDGY